MNRCITGLFAAGLAMGLGGTVQAQTLAVAPSPTVDVVINGVTFDLSSQISLLNGVYFMPSQTIIEPLTKASILISSTGNPDPTLSYSFSATNPALFAIPFAFDESIPLLTPIRKNDLITTSLTVGLTDGDSDGVTFTPTSSTGAQRVTGDGTDLGFSIGTSEIGPIGGSTAFTFATSGNSPIAFNNLDFHLAFSLSGGFDNAGITGRVSATNVPEPGTWALMAGMGLSGAGFVIRRKRRA